MAMRIHIKRAYEAPDPEDGYRVLVDRLWPRGVRKEALALDAWAKDLTPSDQLRRWFGHEPSRWAEFVRRYRAELRKEPAASAVQELVARARKGKLTLIHAARDEEHNGALVLRGVMVGALGRGAVRSPARARTGGKSAPKRVR